MKKDTKDERVFDAVQSCTCERCPSYIDCSKHGKVKERAFCLPPTGMSICIKQEKGCICGACPVKEKMKLKHFYFCTRDSEEQQNVSKQ